MAVLITAFTPFGEFKRNMSAEVLELLPEDGNIKKLLLPTSYGGSIEKLRQYLAENPVSAVILTGQAPRGKITVERVAINVGDCSLPDNDGVVMDDAPLDCGGPAAIFSTLPIKKMALAADGSVSNSAGTYVCNSLMYKALRLLDGSGVPCGFVHLPQDGNAAELSDKLMKMVECI